MADKVDLILEKLAPEYNYFLKMELFSEEEIRQMQV